MTRLILPNEVDSVIEPSDLEQRVGSDIITTRYSVSFRADRGAAKERSVDVDDLDVVELEMEDGQRLWVRVDELENEFGITLNRSGDTPEDGAIRIPTSLPMDGRTRGLGSWAIKGLKIIGIDIAGSITDFVKGKVEGGLAPGAGLYRCSGTAATDLKPVNSIDKSLPILVFLHGTASSTDGSFGALWQGNARPIGDLLSHYQDQVLAYQHQSLSLSPIENALGLLKKLVALKSTVQGSHPLRVHLVSHSRGGLIGEILCRATRDSGLAFDDNDLAFFSGEQYSRDNAALQELGSLMSTSDLLIERFIRVACPARGTTLADGRLDRYLSGMFNIMDKVPGLSNPVVDGVSSLLLAVVKKRTDPEELPGMEAMMPGSPTIRMLNRPDVTVSADLHVIGGDVKASGFVNRLKVIITDLFYREDHDLVVNTPSMFGGASRTNDVRYWVDTGKNVNHFQYFGNSATTSRLSAALLENEAAFHTLDVKPFEVSEDHYRKRSLEPQPIVFVLPGIMGSHLALDDDRIWLDFLEIACGGIGKLSIDKGAPRVRPVKPLDDAYGELLKYLAATHDVRPFPYDWRISIEKSAELLRAQVELALDEATAAKQPIRFVAHSMGGLVVRAMLATPAGDALWQRIRQQEGARFIMLGTPNGGAHSMAAMLIGRDALVRKLALLDFKSSYAELLQTIAQYDGVLQLLPHDGKLDLYDPVVWEKLRDHDVPDKRGVFGSKNKKDKSAGVSWSLPAKAQLKSAAAVRDLIRNSPLDADLTIYVAGAAPATAVDIIVDENARKEHQVQVHATSSGDGRVTWATGIPSQLPARNVYYMDALHGDLANTAETFPALLQLLEDGATGQLSNTPIVGRGSSDERFIMPALKPDMYPDRAALVSAVLGGRREVKRLPTTKCNVRIVHGDLARSRFPVTVGHYAGDTIVSAESYLDQQLDGGLRKRHQLGIYPNKCGTSIVLLNWPDDRERKRSRDPVHPGAVVVGLGTVGDLTPGSLTSTLVDGFLEYALKVRDAAVERSRRQESEPLDVVNAPLTTLLISSGNDLTVSDSLRSILRAVAMVNTRLQPPAGDDSGETQKPYVRIPELDVIEYWEDRAIQATRALVNVANTNDFNEDFEFQRQLVEGQDGRRRVSFDDEPGWWQRMRISVTANDDLKFETLTERARVESQLQSTQRILVDRFLARAAASSTYDPLLGKTLFELIMPNQLKQYAPDRRDLILMLDEKAAVYPWELLQDGFDSSGRPMAVEAGIVRQLVSDEFREQPLMSQASTALVIGDPVADDVHGGAFPRLPGAADEAHLIASELNAAAYDTTVLVGEAAKPLDVVTALYEKPYRILHIAAHGVFDMPIDDAGRPVKEGFGNAQQGAEHSSQKRVSGVVLGDGIYLTPSEFEQMRSVPELVFINCCYLGKQGESKNPRPVEYHRLAANVATQLIRMGVRCVVAAGWAVDDDAAKLFAHTFYENLLRGRRFGDSVEIARRASYELELRRNGNTWGAYQCYGDPDFSLRTSNTYSASDTEEPPLSSTDLVHRLEDIARSAGYQDSQRAKDALKQRLERLIKTISKKWYKSGTVCSAVATAYAQLGCLEKAASYYEKANTSEHADASILSLEQLVNMKARLAVEIADASDSKEDAERAFGELAAAEKIIDSLIGINPSQERYSIKGGVHKRWAKLGTKSVQRDQLVKMAEAYHCAHARGVASENSNEFYPLQNCVAANIALSWCTSVKEPPKPADIKADIEQLGHYLDGTNMSDADFWTACQEPDLLLLKALSNNRILSKVEMPPIIKGYQKALKRGGSERQFKTMTEHLYFFLKVATIQLPKGQKEAKNLCAALEQLLAALKAD